MNDIVSNWVTDKNEDAINEIDEKFAGVLDDTDKFIKKDRDFGYIEVKYLHCDAAVDKMYIKAMKCYKKAKTGYLEERELDKMRKLIDPYKLDSLDDKYVTKSIRMCYNDCLGHKKDLEYLISTKRKLDDDLDKAVANVNKQIEDEREEKGYNDKTNKVGELVGLYNNLYQNSIKYLIREYNSCLTVLSREVDKYKTKDSNKKDKE